MDERYDSQEEYNADLELIMLVAYAALATNPARLLRAILESQNVGHIFHPTAYRAGMKELDKHEKVVEAVLDLKRVMLEVTAEDGSGQ